ncbi:MAG: hypothetical protein ACE37F_37140 [Nannocystaceae bacterium]
MKAWMAMLISPLLAGCMWGWNSWPAPPEKESATQAPDEEPDATPTGQLGRAVGRMTYAPATLTGNRHLGVPFNGRLEVVGHEKLYESTIRQIDVGGFDARWSFVDLRESNSGNASLGLKGIAGISGSLGLERGSSYAIYSFEEIDHCYVIDEGVVFEAPRRGRFFPVEICYGRRFSRIYSSSESKLTETVQAELLGFPFGVGAKRTRSAGYVSAREWGEGLRRKEDCEEVNFSKFGSVGDCFQVGPALPIRVRWREIKRKRHKRPKAAARQQPVPPGA